MSRRSKYPRDLEGLALLWRHRTVMRLLEQGYGGDPAEALLAVVAPSRELLEASRVAVQERAQEKAVA